MSIAIEQELPFEPENEFPKGSEQNPFTREEAIEQGIDVDKVEAEAVPLEDEQVLPEEDADEVEEDEEEEEVL